MGIESLHFPMVETSGGDATVGFVLSDPQRVAASTRALRALAQGVRLRDPPFVLSERAAGVEGLVRFAHSLRVNGSEILRSS